MATSVLILWLDTGLRPVPEVRMFYTKVDDKTLQVAKEYHNRFFQNNESVPQELSQILRSATQIFSNENGLYRPDSVRTEYTIVTGVHNGH